MTSGPTWIEQFPGNFVWLGVDYIADWISANV